MEPLLMKALRRSFARWLAQACPEYILSLSKLRPELVERGLTKGEVEGMT